MTHPVAHVRPTHALPPALQPPIPLHALQSRKAPAAFQRPPGLDLAPLQLPRANAIAFMALYRFPPYEHVRQIFRDLLQQLNISPEDAACSNTANAPYPQVPGRHTESTCTVTIRMSDTVDLQALSSLVALFRHAMEPWVVRDPEHPACGSHVHIHSSLPANALTINNF